MTQPVYLDCAATAPIEPCVLEVVMHHLVDEYGNAGSRTHEYGARAKKAVETARAQVADVVDADPTDVIFTSGATEADNLAILGLRRYGERTGRRHIVSTAIEHKAVLDPLDHLRQQGFDIDLVAPDMEGRVPAEEVLGRVRADTLLVSVMHVNNETGAIQPVAEIARAMPDHVWFHVDAAQGFGKVLNELRSRRIDMIALSGHKIHAPKGVGALVVRRRQRERPPLAPLMFGGGQERGLRPGTHPVHLIAGLGVAAQQCVDQHAVRLAAVREHRSVLRAEVERLGGSAVRGEEHQLPHILNFAVPGVDGEAAIVALRDCVALSNGSACTSERLTPSHVLTAQAVDDWRISGALRVSFSHLTTGVNPGLLTTALAGLVDQA